MAEETCKLWFMTCI